MRAYLMTGPGEIGLAEVADPLCKSDQILVATEAVSICSTDVSYFRGHAIVDDVTEDEMMRSLPAHVPAAAS